MKAGSIFLSLSSAILAVLPCVAADEPDPSVLTIDRIFVKNEFSTKGYSHKWLSEGAEYTRLERAKGGGMDVVRYDARTGTKEKQIMVPASDLIPAGGTVPLKIESYSWSKDRSLLLIYTNSKRVWRTQSRGDYWILDRASSVLRQLGGDAPASTMMFAKIAPDNSHVAYVRERNLYVENLLDQTISKLTNTREGIINGSFDWVYEEELGIRDGFRWSPDSQSIAYWQLDESQVKKHTMIDNLSGLYPKTIEFGYPKVGQRNSHCRIGVVRLENAKTRWMRIPGDARNHYLARMEWATNSKELSIQQLNRLQNTNRVVMATAANGAVRTVLTERDDAWVNVNSELRWIEDGKRFTWMSERDGWRHIYLADRRGTKSGQVTRGKFDVIALQHVDEEKKLIYFTASPDNPAERYLYRVGFDGKKMHRVTPDKDKAGKRGSHSYSISADGSRAFVTSSNVDALPTIRLVSLPDHKQLELVEDNKGARKKFAKLRRKPAEFVYLDIGGPQPLHARVLSPPKYNPKRKYPLLVYVYGEPAGQTVRDSWGRTSHLWHLMLAQKGYFVVTIDNRGTAAPRGRDWRKSIYRKVGIDAPRQQADAIKQLLKDRPYLDADRIGVWGWSGGGSMSLNAIFKFPELYRAAMAVAPVPNQRHYDTIYQERYMGLPGDNVEGYREGSPIHFAQNLKGNLLIVHGTGDDNCHYQTFEKLVDRLIHHNKPFTMMAYPNRTHSIREGRNTTRHLFSLMTGFLTQHLPAGAR
jgi:dipeptidyl-peptidase-4